MDTAIARQPVNVRERILQAAYKLFSERGISNVGIDAIVSESGCAKSSLYNNFASKEELALEFLKDRETAWTHGWLEESIYALASTPEGRLLAIFDVFDGWFHRDDFEGCSFVNILLESEKHGAIRDAASGHLANIRQILKKLATDARLVNPDTFAGVWHILMKGSIVSAGEGNRDAASLGRHAGRLVLDGWARSW
ncbi:MAG: TetR/AcrR family transcriptional regulator [Woeseia sp.]